MFKRRLQAGVVALFASTLVACGSATPVFAQANPDAEQSAVTVEEASDSTTSDTNSDSSTNIEITDNTSTESETIQSDDTDSADSSRDVSGALTPDGSLTLVDDVDDEDAENMQFMTVTTRDGSYYYIIIDRSGSEDNVYFLNAVDAADLMSVMTDEEKEELAESASSETEDSSTDIITPTIVDDDSQADGDATDADAEDSDTDSQTKTTSALPMLGVFAFIGAMIAGAYYLLKIKPEKEQAKDVDEDREFYDDDEYVNEDEWLDEDDEDGSGGPKLEHLDADDFPDADEFLDEEE